MTILCRVSCFPFWCPLFRSCVACPVSYVARLVVVIAVFLVVSPCLYPCRFACTLFSVPLLGVGVWGVGVVLLGLLGVFPGSGLALWVCVPCSVCPLLGRVLPRLGMVCLWVCRGIVLCRGAFFWCIWFVVYSMSVFWLVCVSVFALYDVYRF